MRAKKPLAAVICAGLMSALTPTLADAEINLSFTGSGGQAPQGGPVDSFSWGVSRPTGGAAGGGATGRAKYQQVTLTKPIDSNSPAYPYHVNLNRRLKAQIYFNQPNSADGLALCMDGVTISEYELKDVANPSGSGPDDLTESLTLNYTKISYVIFLDGGPFTATFDLTRGRFDVGTGDPCPQNP